MEYENLKKIRNIGFSEMLGMKNGELYTGQKLVNEKIEDGWELLKITDNSYIIGWFNETAPKEDEYEKFDFSEFRNTKPINESDNLF